MHKCSCLVLFPATGADFQGYLLNFLFFYFPLDYSASICQKGVTSPSSKVCFLAFYLFFLSLFPILVGVANRMERLHRDFLWGGMGGDFKFHLVNWNDCCSPIRLGGLGIKKVVFFDRALLGSCCGVMGMKRWLCGGGS